MRHWLLLGALVSALTGVLSACDFFNPSVRIGRDHRGMAHVYASSLYGLYYGYGYSIAEDRLFQLDSTARTVWGKAAEVFGADYISTDQHVRHNTDFASVARQVEALAETEPEVFEMLKGFADGINAYLNWCLLKPEERLPPEYAHFQTQPRSWTIEDVVMLYVGTMAYRYADFNYELNNLDFLQALQEQHGNKNAWAIFNAAYPVNIAGSLTTVPVPKGEKLPDITVPARPDYLDKLHSAQYPSPLYHPDGRPMRDWRDHQARQQAERAGEHWRLGRESASNVWMVRAPRLSDAEAALVNGPQFNFVNPSYVYGVALHGKDFQLFGNSLYGYPNLLFAHNGTIGWGSTAGFGDQVDVFQLPIHQEKPNHYYYDGQWRPLEIRTQTILVKDADPVEFTSAWTVIGPVMARSGSEAGSVIYVRRRAWQDQSVSSLVQWLKLPLARNQQQFTDILAKFSLSINFYYIDTDGQLGYIHGGHYPRRAPGHDNRLPLALGVDSVSDWRGIRPFAENPQHFDPVNDYLVNWNNRPSASWPNSDIWWAKWSLTDRAGVLERDIDQREQMSVADTWGLIKRSSYSDLNFPHLRTSLHQALAQSEHPLAVKLLTELSSWDQRWSDEDVDGYYDSPACAWMQEWLPILLIDVFADDIPASELGRFLSSGYPVKDIGPLVAESMGVSIVVRHLNQGAAVLGYDFFNGEAAQELINASVDRALLATQERYGSSLKEWSLANPGWRFSAVNFRGVPTGLKPLSGKNAQMNRGSENNMFVVKNGKMIGYDVVPPGQNAYQTDQIDAFLNFQHYPLGEQMSEGDFEHLTTLPLN